MYETVYQNGYNANPYNQISYTNTSGYPATNQTTIKKAYSPDVMDALTKPAIDILDVVRMDKMRPENASNWNPPQEYKVKRARCVHRISTTDSVYSGYVTLKRMVAATKDGTIRCKLCKAKMLEKFDDSMKEKIKACVEVIDTIIAFGPDLGLVNHLPNSAEPLGLIDKMIDTKEFLNVYMNRIAENFIQYAKNDTAAHESEQNITDLYYDRSKSQNDIPITELV